MDKNFGFQPPVVDEQKDWFFQGANTQLAAEPLVPDGQKFLTSYTLGDEWVGRNDSVLKIELMIEALKYSPLGASVVAWYEGSDGSYYFPEGSISNHWTCIYGYEYGKYWLVFDSDDT